MTRSITVTISIDVPDGASVTHQEAAHTVMAPIFPDLPAPEPPALPPPDMTPAAVATFGDDIAQWPTGGCPKHQTEQGLPRPWKAGQRGGWYCSAKDESTSKGYCDLLPGKVYRDKLIPTPKAMPA